MIDEDQTRDERMGPAFLGLRVKEIRNFFNSDDYLSLYADIRNANIDPFQHYINHGWREKRKPWRKFDVQYYTERHIGGNEKVCPLAHYVLVGHAQGLAVNSSQEKHFSWVSGENDAWQDEMCRLMATLGYDAERFRSVRFGKYIRVLFSPDYYRAKKGLDGTISDNECFIRYLTCDFFANMAPGPLFDQSAYVRKISEYNLPPLEEKETLFEHWISHGISRDISPNDLFSAKEYIELNPDIKEYPGSSFEHFLFHGLDEQRQFIKEFTISGNNVKGVGSGTRRFAESVSSTAEAIDEVAQIKKFRTSSKMKRIISECCEIDPAVTSNLGAPGLMAPWHDAAYQNFKHAMDALPNGDFDTVVLIPFCKVGGADYVAGILSRILSDISGKVLVLQTDKSDWSRPDWFGDISRSDLSTFMQDLGKDSKTRMLYEIIRAISPKNVFNVNSRSAFDTFERFGRQLKTFTNLHAYYFCADRTSEGVETGYPVWYFASTLPFLRTAITDNKNLARDLCDRFSLSPKMRENVAAIYTPAMSISPEVPIVDEQVMSSKMRTRPKIMWAGRFDRQKRFDLLLDTARELSGVDFHCWGKAVLDTPPDLSSVPSNVTLYEPFTSYDDLPLRDVDGFFYTADWDGIPTILIELGVYGMPVVASASGGVPELISVKRGWTVPVGSSARDYAEVISEMLENPEERKRRAHALRAYVREHHSESAYASALKTLL